MSEKFSVLPTMAETNSRESVEQLAAEVQAVRESLGRLMSEFDRRVRQTLNPLGLRHPLAVFGLAGLTFLLFIGGAVGIAVRRTRRPAGPIKKAQRLGRAVARMVEYPDRVAQPAPNIGREVLGAVGTVVAATVAKKVMNRALSKV